MSQKQLALPLEKTGYLTTGMALFSMFFGAGNLIFPLLIGRLLGDQVWYAISGLAITAILVPFLGLATMMLYNADCDSFFGRLGKAPGIAVILFLQLILGPLGVIPRLVTLMHAAAEPYLLGMPPLIFNLAAAAAIFGWSFNRNKLLDFLGRILTPVLLLALSALFYSGLTTEFTPNPAPLASSASFFEGLLGGYNTMDLIAAFLFATVILPLFKKENEQEHPSMRKKALLKKIFFSASIAALLLFITYAGLCLIAARHGWSITAQCPPEQLLGAIATHLLGGWGGAIAAIAVITACLTTAITLAAIFSDYLRKTICKEKISETASLSITLLITLLFANLGFSGLAAFLGPVLQVVYPCLIALTLFNLSSFLLKTRAQNALPSSTPL